MKKTNTSPPALFIRFFRWFCHPSLTDSIEGDLMELYNERRTTSGKRIADWRFAGDVILLCRPGIVRSIHHYDTANPFTMFRNYLKVGVRNILRYKAFSFINVFGLAVAMAVCMLIILMLADQKRYDAFHANKDRIYRILSDTETGRQPYATSPYPLAAALKSEYTVAEETLNLTPGVAGDASYLERAVEIRGYFADASFFNVFSFELEQGNAFRALVEPNSIVITRAIAERLFKDANPIGKTIEVNDRQMPFPIASGASGAPVSWGSFTVTGVIDEKKYLSHLKFDALVSSSTRQLLYAEKKIEDLSNNWEWYYRTYTYVLVKQGKTTDDLTGALNHLVANKYAGIKSEQTKGFTLSPQKLGDIQLELQGNDTDNRLPLIGYYFLTVLAAVIMVSACLNYTNLSIARALTRAKEIGVRKVTGANRKALVYQFLSESVLTALLAMIMAIALLTFIKPAFRNLWVNKHFHFELPDSVSVYLTFVGFAIVIGIIAGLYPALHLSGYQPVSVLKKLDSIRPGKLGMRKVLSVFQFVISLFFVTTSILIFHQFKHYMAFDYGFTSKNIVNVELQGSDYRKLAHAFSSVAGVSTVSACDIVPATGTNNNMEIKKTGTDDDYAIAGILNTDEHFTSNLGLRIIAGRNFNPAGEGADNLIIVNEETVRKLGYKNAAAIVGETFETKWGKESLEVIGVVEDFRYRLLVNKHEIGPLVMRNRPNFMYLNVKIASPDLMGTVAKMEEVWKRFDPLHSFKYEFFDDALASTHQAILDVVSILGFIAFLAVVIACLGMLGMAMYTAERKRKEVGIRKVLGAEDLKIALLLSGEFFKVLTLAIIIGAPLSYIVNNLWLQKLPNRVEFGPGTVISGTVILLILGLMTIGSQTLQASRRNPVDALRSE